MNMSSEGLRLTVVAIAWFVIFGRDGDVLMAVPLGMLVGILVTIFVAAAQSLQQALAAARLSDLAAARLSG